MEVVFSKLVIGIITVIIAVMGLFFDNRKEGKITAYGRISLVLLILLGLFTIWSDLSKEIADLEEKNENKIKELAESDKREQQYKEYINYFTLIREKSEKTLTMFDSSAIAQSKLLENARSVNSELLRARSMQNEIRNLSSFSLDESRKTLYPLSDSITAVLDINVYSEGFQSIFKKENALNKGFVLNKNCEFDTTEWLPMTNLILKGVIQRMQQSNIDLLFVKGKNFAQYNSYDMRNYSRFPLLDLCEEEIEGYINEDGIQFKLLYPLKFQTSFFMSSVLDLDKSTLLIGFHVGQKGWDHLLHPRIIDTLKNIKRVTLLFDEKKLFMAIDLPVKRANVDSFIVDKVNFWPAKN